MRAPRSSRAGKDRAIKQRDIIQRIHVNAAEIRRLHGRIHETYARRDESREDYVAWEHACADFHHRYDTLAFLGGYHGAPERIASGDTDTIEVALCFLELRPYFFRSGYMFTKLLRCMKRADLSETQAARFERVIERRREWRERHGPTPP